MRAEIIDRLLPLSDEEKKALETLGRMDRDLYMSGNIDVVRAEKVLGDGDAIALRPHTRFVAFPEHRHGYVELVYVIEGKMKHRVNGKDITLGKGEILLLGEYALHSIEPSKENDLAVNVLIRPSFFSSVLSGFGEGESNLKKFLVDTLTGKEESGYLHFFTGEVVPITNLMENLLWIHLFGREGRKDILRSTAVLLFNHLLSLTSQAATGEREKSVLLSSLSYIEDNYKDGTLELCAEMVGQEMSSLSRLLKRETGKTWTELVVEKRIENSKWLLRNSDENIDDIARSVGYENISYFHRLFRKSTGLSPREYRVQEKTLF